MPITMNSFTCPNGHSFEANAKLRARCPDCGAMTRKSFTDTKPKVDVAPKVDEKPEPKKEPVKAPVLLRQGRPRKALVEPKKPLAVKKPLVPNKPIRTPGKVAAGLVKSHRIKGRGVIPSVNRRPVKTAVARGIQGHEVTRPYWHDVADKYGL